MKTFKASVDTEIITSEDGLNTYEVIKKLSLPEGKCGYLISLYPTRNESNRLPRKLIFCFTKV